MIKRAARKADRLMFNSFFQHRFIWLANESDALAISSRRSISVFEKGFDYRCVTHYGRRWNRLAELCDQFGSDKGQIRPDDHPYDWSAHTYTDYYSILFDHCREHVLNVFECGLGTNNPDFRSNMGINGQPGASLRVWRDYFPRAGIVGADIDAGILFTEPRIATFQVDQTDPGSIADLWRQVDVELFDLMIDDGLHEFDAGSCLFNHSIHKLSPNGIYIIEDVKAADLDNYRNFFISRPFTVDYVNLHRPDVEVGDNSLIIIRHGQPDGSS